MTAVYRDAEGPESRWCFEGPGHFSLVVLESLKAKAPRKTPQKFFKEAMQKLLRFI